MASLSRDIVFENGIYYPCSGDEVIALIKAASKTNSVLRVVGSQHSPLQAIMATAHEKQILCVLSGNLCAITDFRLTDDGQYAIVRVGAGCHLGVDPKVAHSTWGNSFNYQLDQRGFALPTLGGISHQTIAGFLQTSSSGGSYRYGIAEVIESVEIVTGDGNLRVLKQGEDAFHAAGVALGLFGVLVYVTFKCPKKYFVVGVEENKLLADSYLAKNSHGQFAQLKRALFQDYAYAHINWFPQQYVDRVMQWTANPVSQVLQHEIEPYHHPLQSKLLSWAAAAILKTGNIIDTYALSSRIAQRIKALLLRPFVALNDKQNFCDLWYKALPIDDQADVDGLINTAFSEMWFAADHTDEVMWTLEKLFEKSPYARGNFIVELYAAKASPFWLSPSYGHNALRVDLYWWHKNTGNAHDYFAHFWRACMNIPTARFHWGKVLPTIGERYGHHCFDRNFIANAYPRFAEWCEMRKTYDTQQLFMTAYWRDLFG